MNLLDSLAMLWKLHKEVTSPSNTSARNILVPMSLGT